MQATSIINNPVLQIGATGAPVKELQQLLNLFEYHLTIDGIFGSVTQDAVKSYQRTFHNHLPVEVVVNGVVDHQFWSILYSHVFNSAPKAMPILKFGCTGEAVQLLQNCLNQFTNVVQLDGVFGAKTEAAVKTVQKNNLLVADGVVGSQTWAALSLAQNE